MYEEYITQACVETEGRVFVNFSENFVIRRVEF